MNTQTHAQVRNVEGRIAYSSDGNQHDRDDIGANAVALSMLAAAKMQNKLVYFDYANHIWGNGSN